MNIDGFRVKRQKLQKLWVILFVAFSVAVFLIALSFYFIFSIKDDTSNSKCDVFDCKFYHFKSNVTIYGNKNQNSYDIEEYCNLDLRKTRVNMKSQYMNYSYISTDNSFYIKSDSQILTMGDESYNNDKINILSLSTFISIYNDVKKSGGKDESLNMFSIKESQKDNKVIYTITLDSKKTNSNNMYSSIINSGMNITKMELIMDKIGNKPEEYIIYSNGDKAYADIIYSEFQINPKFDEKVFSF